MSLERSDIASALKTKGFREQTDRDHDYYTLYIGEARQTIYTKLSRGKGYRTLGDDLVRLIARQMNLSKGELGEFVTAQWTAQITSPT